MNAGLVDNLYLSDAVLITGGSGSVGNTTELYAPSSGLSCPLPSLPTGRYAHTVDSSGLLCGGWDRDTGNTCLKWRPDAGKWEDYLTLNASRFYHSTWTPESGIGTYLMGGGYPGPWTRTTTLIKPDGTQEPGFSLKNPIE